MDPDIRALALAIFWLGLVMLLLGMMLVYLASHAGC